MPDHDYTRLDEVLHSRIRIAAVTALAGVEEAEFVWLREKTGATDGNLALARYLDELLRMAGAARE
jgi:hypothetical protein